MLDLFSNTEEDMNKLPFEFPQSEGYSVQWNSELNGYVIHIPNGVLFYSERFFDKKISDRSVEYFLENDTLDAQVVGAWRAIDKEKLSRINFKNIDWQHEQINMYGKKVYQPRYTAWYGDEDKDYRYSGISMQPKSWNKGLLYIKKEIEKVASVQFNTVLMNWYRDGDDHVSWHADDEKELGKNPEIASVSFGETRRFLLRRNDDPSQKLEFPLQHGTLLIMSG
ncbi:MAG: alpha-ketoglutarate-dependent dioxygenase AlkB, partial [Balneola sp.]